MKPARIAIGCSFLAPCKNCPDVACGCETYFTPNRGKKQLPSQALLRLDEGGVTVHSVPPRGVFMRILHENPETACAKMSSFAHFVCIMLQFTAKP